MNIHSRGSLIFHGVYFGIVAVLSVLLLVVSTVDDSDGVHITVMAIAMVLISMLMLASFFRSVHVHRGSSVEIDARRRFDKALDQRMIFLIQAHLPTTQSWLTR